MDTSAVISIVLSAFAGVVIPIVLLYIKRHINVSEALNNQRFQNIENIIAAKHTNLEQQIIRLEEKIQGHDTSLERIHDRWDQFLRDYMKVDTSRGSKIDAMFRVLDSVNEKLRQTRDDINKLRLLEEHLQEIKLRVVTLETIISKAGQK